MFRTVPLSIIRRFHCTYSTCFGQFLCPSSGDLTVFTLHVSDSSSVHHQEISLYLLYMFRTVPLSTIRSFSLYLLYMFRTVPPSIIRNFSLHTLQWYMSYRFVDSCRTAVPSWSCSQAVSKPVWHTPLLCLQWKTPDDGQRNCPKHVEFLFQKTNLRN